MKASHNEIRTRIIVYFKRLKHVNSHCKDEMSKYFAICKCIEQIGESSKELPNDGKFDVAFVVHVRNALVHRFEHKSTKRLVTKFLKRSEALSNAIKHDILSHK